MQYAQNDIILGDCFGTSKEVFQKAEEIQNELLKAGFEQGHIQKIFRNEGPLNPFKKMKAEIAIKMKQQAMKNRSKIFRGPT